MNANTLFSFNTAEKTVSARGDVLIPQVLLDIADALKTEKIQISEKVEGEGRGGSLHDEGTIKRFLQGHPKFENRIKEVEARGFGDMRVLDYNDETLHVVNIKTSHGSSDNATSKLGFLYAFTDMSYDELPGSIAWKKFHQLLIERKADIPYKDYWFLCVDKTDSSNVMIRGAKQIVNWRENANPSNLLQINWSKEKSCQPANRTYDEAYEVIINGIVRCFKKAYNKLPDTWREEIMSQ